MNRAARFLFSRFRYGFPVNLAKTTFRISYVCPNRATCNYGVRYFCLSSTHCTSTNAEERDNLIEQLESFQDHTDHAEILNFIHDNHERLAPVHVTKALDTLRFIQARKDKSEQTFDAIGKSPVFGKVSEMILEYLERDDVDNDVVVSNLYALTRLGLEASHPLIQQLFLKGCRSIENMNLHQLSKFVATFRYISDAYYLSPTMSPVMEMFSRRLDDITEIRTFSQLMVCVARLSSPGLKQRLAEKAVELMAHCDDERSPNSVYRILYAVSVMRLKHRKLLDTISQYFIGVMEELDSNHIYRIKYATKELNYYNKALDEVFRKHLLSLVPESHDSFPEAMIPSLLWCLGPMVPRKVRHNVEVLALRHLPTHIEQQKLVSVLQALEAMGCRNQTLLQKVANLVQEGLNDNRQQVAPALQAAKTFTAAGYQDKQFLSQLRYAIVSEAVATYSPRVAANCLESLSHLPGERLEDGVVKKINAMLPQFNFAQLGLIMQSLRTLMTNAAVHKANQKTLSELFRNVNATVIDRLDTVRNFRTFHKVVLSYYIDSPSWTSTFLIEEIIKWYENRLGEMGSVTGYNLASWAVVMSRMRYLHGLILDTLANTTVKKMDTLQNEQLVTVLTVLGFLNYSPTNAEEFFWACIEFVTRNMSTIPPHVLVRMAYALALLQRLPAEIVKAVFQVKFLEQLDTYLEKSTDRQNTMLRDVLMRLNRAVVLENPEYDIPWFHGQHCLEVAKKVPVIDGAEKQVMDVLTNVLGGAEFVRSKVVSPYFQTIDFECYLSEEGSALPCVEYGDFYNRAEGTWQKATKPLPATAHRVAIDYQDALDFCRNSQHPLGHIAMRKRHLEILGYTVVQIPHFEWNSMKLGTEESWQEYLQHKLSAAVGR